MLLFSIKIPHSNAHVVYNLLFVMLVSRKDKDVYLHEKILWFYLSIIIFFYVRFVCFCASLLKDIATLVSTPSICGLDDLIIWYMYGIACTPTGWWLWGKLWQDDKGVNTWKEKHELASFILAFFTRTGEIILLKIEQVRFRSILAMWFWI